jgi:hypothetical protein
MTRALMYMVVGAAIVQLHSCHVANTRYVACRDRYEYRQRSSHLKIDAFPDECETLRIDACTQGSRIAHLEPFRPAGSECIKLAALIDRALERMEKGSE